MAEDKTSRAVGSEIIKGAVAGAFAAAASGDLKTVAVGSAFGALGGGGAEMLTRAIASFRPGNDAGFHEAHAELAARAVESVKEPLEEKIRALEEKIGANEAASSVPPITNAWGQSWAKAEGKKQRVLMAALVSAFDPESYEAAMSRRFFKLIDELDYPEIRYLCTIVRERRSSGQEVGRRFTEDSQLDDEGTTHRRRLAELGLIRANDYRSWSLVWLGVELVAFLDRGGFNDADSKGEGTKE